jgi:hypothetical protein
MIKDYKKIAFVAVDHVTNKQYFVADTVKELKEQIEEHKAIVPKTIKIYKVKGTFKYRLLNV